MEAGGIEPPSRDCFRVASTCVVDPLFVRHGDADRPASHCLSQTVFSHRNGQTSFQCQLANVVVPNSERLGHDGLPIVRQPWHTSCCHIRFIARGFTRPPDNLGTPQSRLLARSNPIAPVSTTKEVSDNRTNHTLAGQTAHGPDRVLPITRHAIVSAG